MYIHVSEKRSLKLPVSCRLVEGRQETPEQQVIHKVVTTMKKAERIIIALIKGFSLSAGDEEEGDEKV